MRERAVGIRSNHYDVAFEAFLRDQRQPYVFVDETRRAQLQSASLKSMDFVVYSARGRNLLVDVKGRRYPSGGDGGHRWENWATDDDVESLLNWEQVFGTDFRAVFVFAYEIISPDRIGDHQHVWEFRRRSYAFYGVWVDEFAERMRTRSASWETVGLRSADFRELRRPFRELL